MDGFIKTGFVIGLLALYISVNLWVLKYALESLFPPRDGGIVYPFNLIGSPDAPPEAGGALAGMLVARLANIDEELEAASRALERARGAVAPMSRAADVVAARSLPLPDRVFEPLDISLVIGGVEASGFISRIHRGLSRHGANHFTVMIESGKATVAGNGPVMGARSLLIEGVDASNSAIVEAIAYSLVRRNFAERFPNVLALEGWQQFRDLLKLLRDLAATAEQEAHGGNVAVRYAEHGKQIGAITRTVDWDALHRIEAEIALKAGDDAAALVAYRRERARLAQGDRRIVEIDQETAALERKIRLQATAQESVARTAAAHSRGDNASERADLLRATPAGQAVLNAIGGPPPALSAAPPVIAIVGGPPHAVDRGPDDILLDGAAAPADTGDMASYVSTLAQTARLELPEARFLFDGEPFDSSRPAGMLRAIGRLAERRPAVLLFAFGPLRDDAVVAALDHLAAAGTVVVVAGAHPDRAMVKQAAAAPLLPAASVIVADPVEPDGRQAWFSSQSPGAVNAPGVNIPAFPTETNRIDVRSGAAYAAALVAAVAARLKAERPGIAPADVAEALRLTARPASDDAVPVVDRNAALARVTAGL